MRQIIWSDEFSAQVEKAGGARLVDEALTPIIDGLMRNPYGFQKYENDFVSFRYAKVEALQNGLGSLTVIFIIDEDRNVVLQWFEEELPF